MEATTKPRLHLHRRGSFERGGGIRRVAARRRQIQAASLSGHAGRGGLVQRATDSRRRCRTRRVAAGGVPFTTDTPFIPPSQFLPPPLSPSPSAPSSWLGRHAYALRMAAMPVGSALVGDWRPRPVPRRGSPPLPPLASLSPWCEDAALVC